MASFNKVILLGNLTRDPELRYTPGGNALCSLGLAVNRKFSVGNEKREEACFVDITVWGKQGENCNEYLNKGSSVLIEGRLQFRSWEGNDGQRRSKLDVVAESVQFMPRTGGSVPFSGSGQTATQSKPENQSSQPSGVSFEAVPGISDEDDIPF